MIPEFKVEVEKDSCPGETSGQVLFILDLFSCGHRFKH